MKRAIAGGLAAYLLVIGLAATPAMSQAGGDPDSGADAFDANCGDCHSLSARGLNKKGPTLFHVIGRRAGNSPGFAFSAPMRASGIVWTPERINAYLANPRAVVPGGIMKFRGLPRPQDRANVIAYLQHPD